MASHRRVTGGAGRGVTSKTIGKVFASYSTLLNKLDIALTLVD